MRGLRTATLKVFGTYPNDNDELIIFKRGSKLIIFRRGYMTSGSTSFSNLDGIGGFIGPKLTVFVYQSG